MVLEVDLGSGRGRMLRLQASALTPGEARALCEQMKQAGQYCLPTADTGRPMPHAGLAPANALYIKQSFGGSDFSISRMHFHPQTRAPRSVTESGVLPSVL